MMGATMGATMRKRISCLLLFALLASDVRGSAVESGATLDRQLHDDRNDYYFTAQRHRGGDNKKESAKVTSQISSEFYNSTSAGTNSERSSKPKTDSSSNTAGKGKGGSSSSKTTMKKKSSSKGSKKGSKSKKSSTSKKSSGSDDSCFSETALAIADSVEGVVALNPTECCRATGHVAVYVTNAQPCDSVGCDTETGLEPFFDQLYAEIAANSKNVCFVFTGVDASFNVDGILLNATETASQLPNVVAMMVADSTRGTALINLVRDISDDASLPHIGLFVSGYDKVLLESIVSGRDPLPFVGVVDPDSSYGEAAASKTLELLNGQAGVPLCFNSQLESPQFSGARCTTYYDIISPLVQIEPAAGVSCNQNSTEALVALLDGKNAVWADKGCCELVVEAVEATRQEGQNIVFGCQDVPTADSAVDFVTMQPVVLQAFSASSWANLPIIQAEQGKTGDQFFPSLQSLIKTDVVNVPVL